VCSWRGLTPSGSVIRQLQQIRMCCNFVVESKAGQMIGILVRRREQTENEVVQ
jgi:hypothetical protein